MTLAWKLSVQVEVAPEGVVSGADSTIVPVFGPGPPAAAHEAGTRSGDDPEVTSS